MKDIIKMKFFMHRNFSTSTAAATKKHKVVIIGSGWGGFRLATDLDKKLFEVELISPRNHFLFTPLLPSTAVGTLEFRAIQEPVRTIPNIIYHQAYANKVDFASQNIKCSDYFKDSHKFDITYDSLVIATGCETNTFGIPGVLDNKDVFFLKQLSDARAIRNRIIECFERASSPGTTEAEMNRLLTFLVVGGGPTNVEFSAEMFDFLKKDVSRWYPDLFPRANIKVIEASGHILGSYIM